MKMSQQGKISTEKMVLGALLTALVMVLQLMGASIKFGAFSISLVLIPIVIGAATCGKSIGAWLGFIFGLAVLISGDAATFMAVSIPGTIITVLVKGTLAGFLAGLTYQFFAKYNKIVAVILAAIVCPVVNTGIFLIGCLLFFLETVTAWAGGSNVGKYMIVGLVGINFLFELGINIVLSPVIVRILNARQKQ